MLKICHHGVAPHCLDHSQDPLPFQLEIYMIVETYWILLVTILHNFTSSFWDVVIHALNLKMCWWNILCPALWRLSENFHWFAPWGGGGGGGDKVCSYYHYLYIYACVSAISFLFVFLFIICIDWRNSVLQTYCYVSVYFCTKMYPDFLTCGRCADEYPLSRIDDFIIHKTSCLQSLGVHNYDTLGTSTGEVVVWLNPWFIQLLHHLYIFISYILYNYIIIEFLKDREHSTTFFMRLDSTFSR